MPQQIIIAEQLRIAALLTDERIDELIVAQGRYQIGDVFLGTVENVLPGIDAAFVNIGESEKNGFIHVSDLGPLRLKKGAAAITELLEPRQKVLVQVMKEPTGSKGPRLSGNLVLPGRYIALQPHGQGVNISRKISSEGERNRLRALGVLIKPSSTGLVMRTEAEDISEENLINDFEILLKQWDLIQQAAEECTPPLLLNRDEDFIHRILRDHRSPNLHKIVVDNIDGVERIKKFLGDEDKISIEVHHEPDEILEHYKVNLSIQNALKPRVDLPSGGYIIIEPTEALTVIDVNSGSFTRSANSRETVLWTNCEAAIEIARQLKLRNIGGVIIIDFIDMDTRRDQLQLLEHFTSAIKDDSARPQIAQLTELGLVELTRKRQGQNIYELFGKTCPTCSGQGLIGIIPGKDHLEESATESGLVSSNLNIRRDAYKQTESNNSKKKKNKSKDDNIGDQDDSGLHIDNDSSINSEGVAEENNVESFSNKQEAELITVGITEEEEEIYSLMGLNPILLTENIPQNENLIVHIVRPGEDEAKVLDDAKKAMIANSNKKRKRGKNQVRTNIKSTEEANLNKNIEILNKSSQESNESDEEHQNSNDDITIIEPLMTLNENQDSNDENELSTLEDNIEDPRRRRRRSSASI